MTGRLIAVLAVIAVVGLIPLTGVQVLVTQGTSMAPQFRSGDVAVTYVPRSYRVGDVVAYRSGTLDMVVLHRIVGTQDGGYLTKGDNNSWVDPDRPGHANLRGRLLVRIPTAGLLLPQSAKDVPLTGNPVGAVGAGLLLFAACSSQLHRAHRRRKPPLTTRRPPPAHRRKRSGSKRRRSVLSASAGLGVLAVGTAWLLPGQAAAGPSPVPAVRSDATEAVGPERLVLGYHASTTAVATYPDGRVNTGEPIFVKAVRKLSVTATYTGEPGTPTTVSAEIAHPTGWRRTVPTSASTMQRTASGATASAALDVDVLAGLLKRFADETGLPAPGTALVLIAEAGSWSTRSELSFDGVQFQANPETLTATRSTAPSGTGQTDPSGQAVNATGADGAPSSLGRLLDNKPLAAAAALGLLLLIAAGARAAHRSRHKAGLNVPADRLVPITAHVPADGRTIVDVLNLDQLGRIAHQSTRPVFHMTTPDARVYLLDDGTVIYRLHERTGLATPVG